MARRRMIEITIAHDKDFNALPEFAQLLYLKALPHTDDFGRFEGDVDVFKARADPFGKRPIEQYESAMREIAGAHLWSIYRTPNGKMVIQYDIESFERINAFLIKNRSGYEYPGFIDEEGYELICGDMPAYPVVSKKQEVKSIKQKDKEEGRKPRILYKDKKLVIPDDLREDLAAEFGRLLLDREIPKMESWLKVNKPKKDFNRFVWNWLNRQRGVMPEPKIAQKKSKFCSIHKINYEQALCPKCTIPLNQTEMGRK